MLHCGAESVDEEALAQVSVPEATSSYQPLTHLDFLKNVRFVLGEHGYQISKEYHGLTRGGDRYFGTVELENNATDRDFGWVVGLRNSYDKSYPAGLVAGSRVFVCDNLSFSGEIVVRRKHTTHILRDLPRLVDGMVSQLHASFQKQSEQFDTYKRSELTNGQANDIIVKCLEFGVIPSADVLDVVKEYKQPRYEAFEGRTAWSLFNSFTEILKGRSEFSLPKRTRGLHHILDSYLKFQFSNN